MTEENKLPTVLLVFNEADPEMYVSKTEIEKTNLAFTPYFEIGDTTPMAEFGEMARIIGAQGYNVITLNIEDDLNRLIDAVRVHKPDVIFNCIEIIFGIARLEMCLAGLFELLNVPYTGAPPLALANCQNKALTKHLLRSAGLPTPEFCIVNKLEDKHHCDALRFPKFVKPLFEDASVGIENNSVVHDDAALARQLQYIFDEFKQPALVEEYILGRELNVSVFGDENPVVLPISEIDFSRLPAHLEHIVSYQAKWDALHESYHKTIPICPAQLPEEVTVKAAEAALGVFKLMGLRDYTRVDMRLREDNEIFILEANPNPDLSEGVGFMRSAAAAGIPYGEMLSKIIQLALARKRK